MYNFSARWYSTLEKYGCLGSAEKYGWVGSVGLSPSHPFLLHGPWRVDDPLRMCAMRGQLLANLDLADPSSVQTVKPFAGVYYVV